MTRYDPFAYGEVRLDEHAKAADDPDDVLFAGGDDIKQAPAADPSWSMLGDAEDELPADSQDADPDAARQFGAEILGEQADDPDDWSEPAPLAEPDPVDAEPHPMAQAPMPEPEPEPEPVRAEPRAPAGAVAEPVDEPDGHEIAGRKVVRRKLRRKVASPDARASRAAAEPPRRPTAPAVPGRSRPMLAFAVPLTLSAVGGTAGAWVWVMLANPVLAGLVAATTAVAALFSWLLLRG